MRSQRGITLISLTIYIIIMAIVVGVMAILSSYFYTNTSERNESIDSITEYTKFNSFFSDEVNHQNIKVLECKNVEGEEIAESYVTFNNGVQYTFVPENKGIYRNRVKICRNIEKCTFNYIIENGKEVIEVNFISGDQNRNIKYTLKK